MTGQRAVWREHEMEYAICHGQHLQRREFTARSGSPPSEHNAVYWQKEKGFFHIGAAILTHFQESLVVVLANFLSVLQVAIHSLLYITTLARSLSFTQPFFFITVPTVSNIEEYNTYSCFNESLALIGAALNQSSLLLSRPRTLFESDWMIKNSVLQTRKILRGDKTPAYLISPRISSTQQRYQSLGLSWAQPRFPSETSPPVAGLHRAKSNYRPGVWWKTAYHDSHVSPAPLHNNVW